MPNFKAYVRANCFICSYINTLNESIIEKGPYIEFIDNDQNRIAYMFYELGLNYTLDKYLFLYECCVEEVNNKIRFYVEYFNLNA